MKLLFVITTLSLASCSDVTDPMNLDKIIPDKEEVDSSVVLSLPDSSKYIEESETKDTLVANPVTIESFEFSISFAFVDRVNLRAYPSLDSSVVATVPIGTELYNLSNLGVLTLDGKIGLWVKVLYKDQVCFVWSRLLDRTSLYDKDDPDILIMYGYGNSKDSGMIKALKSGKVISEIVIKGDPRSIHGFTTLDDVGIYGISKMINVIHSAGKCGALSTTVRIAWDGKKLRHFFTEWAIPDAEFLNYVRLILPIHHNDGTEVVHCFEIIGEMKQTLYDENKPQDYRNRPYIDYDKKVHRRMKWNGKELVDINL